MLKNQIYIRKYFNLLILVIFTIIYLQITGCASRVFDDPIYSITAQKVTNSIVINQTSRDEILKTFGKPTHRSNSYIGNKRGETWIYGGHYITGTPSRAWGKIHTLVLHFAGDVVASYKYIENRKDESINIEMP